MTQEATRKKLRSIFDSACASKGGVVVPEDYPEVLRPVLTDALEHSRDMLDSSKDSVPPQYVGHNIYVDLVDNPTLNAVAFERNGYEFIGVNAGTICYLYDSFLALFSHPLFMPDVGDAKVEQTTNKELREYLLRKDITHIHYFPPIDRDRNRAAHFLTLNAYHFVFGHEVGHISKGHIKYIQKKYGLSEYIAFESKALSFGANVRHPLETDADSNGTQVSLNIFGPSSTGHPLPDTGGLRRDFRSWDFSIGIIFALFDLHVKVHNANAEASHPAPDVRFFSVLLSAWEETQQRVPKLLETSRKETINAATELNEFLLRMDRIAIAFANSPSKPPLFVRAWTHWRSKVCNNSLLTVARLCVQGLPALNHEMQRALQPFRHLLEPTVLPCPLVAVAGGWAPLISIVLRCNEEDYCSANDDVFKNRGSHSVAMHTNPVRRTTYDSLG